MLWGRRLGKSAALGSTFILVLSFTGAHAAGGPDQDKDSISDVDDWCPAVKETVNNLDDDDGCPDTRESLVRVDQAKIEILERIGFLSGNATILKRSGPLLDQIAGAVKNTPEIALLRIEGHSDNQGDQAKNLKLSQLRAQAVKAALIARGVESARLEAEGFGNQRPIASNDTEEGRNKNRRVDFVVAKTAKVAPTQGVAALMVNSKGTVNVDQPSGIRGRAMQGMNLPNASTVLTGVDGTAEVSLPSTSRLHLRASTQTKIWTKDDGTGPASRVSVAAGSLWAKVAGPAPGKEKEKSDVTTPNAKVSARGTEFNVNVVKVGDSYSTQVSTLEGKVAVAAGDTVVELPAGQGLKATGTEISAPRALPGMPTGLSPYFGDFQARAALKWSPIPKMRYRVQIARDVEFTELVADSELADPAYTFEPVEGGSYFWRVSAIDDGLEGPSSQRFKIKVEK